MVIKRGITKFGKRRKYTRKCKFGKVKSGPRKGKCRKRR